MDDATTPQPELPADPSKRRRRGLHVPLPAVLVGLGIVAGPVAAQPFTTRPDFFQVPEGVTTFLPILANDTLPNASASFFAPTLPIGNVVAQFGGFLYFPPPGFNGTTGFTYCVTQGVPAANACATVLLAVGDTSVPVPALSAAALAGLSGMLGWLGIRGRRRR